MISALTRVSFELNFIRFLSEIHGMSQNSRNSKWKTKMNEMNQFSNSQPLDRNLVQPSLVSWEVEIWIWENKNTGIVNFYVLAIFFQCIRIVTLSTLLNIGIVSNETNADVRMYIEEFILVEIWIHCCTKLKSWMITLENTLAFIQMQKRRRRCKNCSWMQLTTYHL